ncbi:hypothetical protein FB479_102377 [Brevibacillus sp. AG162]|uniref:BC1872 family protein n=1 Tax=Brevibacillus sp. AG162 TaxID=2572910 RepID=UPI0011712BD5|nr:hypothetical protein [Brevibacillus sp. AG162]TQK73743.1 hypothetical protein FB479_102377 [Brevibacillus sp. AG162]
MNPYWVKYHQQTDSWSKEAPYTWNPLQNIAGAWLLAEKLFIGVLPQSPGSPEDMRFFAVFETHPYDRNIQVYVKTAQEAICRAALETVA